MIRIVSLAWVSLMVIHLISGYKYEYEFEDDILVPCKEYPDHFITKYLQYPENFTLLPDGKVFISGNVVVLYDYHAHNYPAILDFYKKGRGGTWQKTLYSFSRPDVCTSLFDKTEMWRDIVQKVPKEQQKCPPFKGQFFNGEFTSTNTFSMPANSLDGDYMAHFEMGSRSNINDGFLCLEVYFSVYRV